MAPSATKVATQHLRSRNASTGAECDFWKATDGKWYMSLEEVSWDDDGDGGRDSEMKDYGPFPSLNAAIRYLNDNFANPGGWGEDDSGRRKPPRKPIRPTSRWAFNKYNPDELLTQLVAILEKEGLDDAVKVVKGITRDVQNAWRNRDQDKTASAEGVREVAKVYLHLSNGGATYRVIDAGNGPEFISSIGSFGTMDSEIRIQTSPEGLRRIADMLHIAAADDRLSKPHAMASGLVAMPDDLRSFYGDHLLSSMAASLAWWKAREDAEGPGIQKNINLEHLASAVKAHLPLYVAKASEERSAEEAAEFVGGGNQMVAAVARRHLAGRQS